MELLDPKRKCRRCKGTGIFQTLNGPVTCASCLGRGKVPSARDQRRLNAEGARRSCLLKAMYKRAEERDGHRNGDIDFKVGQGYGQLEQNEPHRLDALFDSLEAGRIDDVIDALVAYRNAKAKKN